MRRREGRGGQSAIELSLVLVVGILALVAMWGLMKEAIMGRWKESADTFSFGLQYERQGQPGATVCNPPPC